MTTTSHKRISNGWLIFGLLLGLAGLGIGAFGDLPLNQMVYDPFKVWARLIAAFAPAPAFWGLGAAGFLCLDVLKDSKAMFIGWILAFCLNVVGPVYMADSIAEEFASAWYICWAIGLLVSILPALLYWFLMRKAERKDKVKCLFILLIVCGGSVAGVQVLKRVWARPRYYILEQYDVPFRNWYDFGRGFLNDYRALYEQNHDFFRSFPSGHTQSAACLFVWALIPCFTKKGSVSLAMILAFLGVGVTMFGRLVAGAHFLSDVSAGFLVTFILFCLCCWCFGLTRHDESMYEYDDDDELEERTSSSASRRSRRASRYDDEDDDDEDDDYLFDDEKTVRHSSRASHRAAPDRRKATNEKPAAKAPDKADDDLFEEEFSVVEVRPESDFDFDDDYELDDELTVIEPAKPSQPVKTVQSRKHEKPAEHASDETSDSQPRRRSRRTAADLFDDSFFD